MSDTVEKERRTPHALDITVSSPLPLVTSREVFQPQFIRLPPTGDQDPHTGLSRSSLDLLTRPQKENGFSPPVKSRIVKIKQSSRGVRLIDFADLLRYLNTLSNESPIQGTEQAKAGPRARRLQREEAQP